MEGMRVGHLTRIAAAAAAGRRELLRAWYPEALAAGLPLPYLQEATLQVFLFAGYPRTIDAFEELFAACDAPEPAPREAHPPDLVSRGEHLFARVYGVHADAVRKKLDVLHHDFARFVLRDAYGQVLGRPFLPIAERELMAVSMLGVLGLRTQLQAHVRGALNVGASVDDVRAAIAAVAEVGPNAEQAHDLAEKAISRRG